MYNIFIFYIFLQQGYGKKILGIIFSVLGKLRFFKKLGTLRKKFEIELEGFSDGAIALKNNKGVMLRSFIFQVIQLTFYFIIPYFIFLGIESGKTSMWDMIAAQSIVTMITLMIPSPGSSGGAEGTGYLFFSMFFSRGVILPVVLIWRLITYYSAVTFGGLVSMLAPERPLKRDFDAKTR